MEIKNYTLVKEEYIEEVGGTAYTFRHTRTGAQVCYVSCEDDNKVFYIAFKTLPKDDKGIPHILEHCVLNGSRKFPVKEPFVELIKGSLNTFINAMTYNDKTVFPVASRNAKDFRNLVDVYLDAVFYPNLRKDPFIMAQEGWHYEMTDPEGPITYKGVVFNEMKGAYSSPDRTLYLESERALYPDTVYGTESGGYPESIPELSYEEFCAFHERYYHPSNARIFFYGDGNVEEHLRFLDEEYLSAFDYRDPDAEIALQPDFAAPKELSCRYPSAEDGSEKAYLALGYAIPPLADAEEYFAAGLMMSMLAGEEAAPVRKAMLEAGIGAEFSAEAETGIYQPSLMFVAKDANASDADRFFAIIREEAEKAAENGFDAKLMEGIFNSTEFALRENDFGGAPKGLVLGLSMLDLWLYGDDPTVLLKNRAAFGALREKAAQGYFSELVRKYVLENTHAVKIVMLPDTGLAAAIQKKEDDKLAAYKETLSREEREELCRKTAEMLERQARPDSPEALATIPLLAREDLDKTAEQFPLRTDNVLNRPFYSYPTFTNGIVYLSVKFPTDCLTEEELPYASLLSTVLGAIGTANYSHDELDNEINIVSGGISVDGGFIENVRDASVFRGFLSVSARYLASCEKQNLDLMEEILLRSDLTDLKRLKEIIAECRSGMESQINYRGHGVALTRALSNLSPAAKANELTNGISYYLFLKELEKDFAGKGAETSAKLKAVLAKLLNQNAVTVMVTAEEAQIPATKKNIAIFISKFPANFPEKKLSVRCEAKNEGLMTSGQIQYVAKVGRFRRPYRGSMEVLGKILSMDYLWTNIRVKGGAYGSTQRITRSGFAGMASYRDPNLRESLAVYDAAGPAMQSFECSERELLKYIIGTISDLQSPLTPAMKGSVAFRRFISGTDAEYVQRIWDEVLATTPEQLREDAALLSEAMEEGAVCVLGCRERILGEKELFDVTLDVM